jgi:hypothetical protein
MGGAPPRTVVTVQRLALPGRCYLVDCPATADDAAALRDRGAGAALDFLQRVCPTLPLKPVGSGTDADELFRALMRQVLLQSAIPDRIGVFVPATEDCPDIVRLPPDVSLALLARRSGPLYLPRREFEASLVVPARVALVFPESLKVRK